MKKQYDVKWLTKNTIYNVYIYIYILYFKISTIGNMIRNTF